VHEDREQIKNGFNSERTLRRHSVSNSGQRAFKQPLPFIRTRYRRTDDKRRIKCVKLKKDSKDGNTMLFENRKRCGVWGGAEQEGEKVGKHKPGG